MIKPAALDVAHLERERTKLAARIEYMRHIRAAVYAGTATAGMLAYANEWRCLFEVIDGPRSLLNRIDRAGRPRRGDRSLTNT